LTNETGNVKISSQLKRNNFGSGESAPEMRLKTFKTFLKKFEKTFKNILTWKRSYVRIKWFTKRDCFFKTE